jgi:hypothetical protein
MLKLTFLTETPITPPTLSQLASELFSSCFLYMFLFNTETLASLGCPLNAVFHILRGRVPQDAGIPSLSLLQITPYRTIDNYR